MLISCFNATTQAVLCLFSPPQALFLISMCCFGFTTRLERPRGALPPCRPYNNWQSVNPYQIFFFFFCCVFAELLTNSQTILQNAACFCELRAAGVKNLDKLGQYMKMEKSVKPLRFCARERMGGREGGLIRLTILIIWAGLRPRAGSTGESAEYLFLLKRNLQTERERIAALWLE